MPHLQEAATIHGYTVAFAVSCGLFLTGTILTGLLLRNGQLPETNGDHSPAAA